MPRYNSWERVLANVGARTNDNLIEILLARLAGKSLVEQFFHIGLKFVILRPMLTPGGLAGDDRIFISDLNKDNEDEWVVGHEMAHFMLYPSKHYPSQYGQNRPLENFCDEFGHAWARVGNNEQMARELMETLRWIPQSERGWHILEVAGVPIG